MAEKIRVRAVGGVCVQFRATDGRMVLGRFVGRDADGKPVPGGEELTLTPANRNDYLRAIARGELEEVKAS